MPRIPEFDPISYLVSRRYPRQERGWTSTGLPPLGDWHEETNPDIDAYRQELTDLSSEELSARVEVERAKQQDELLQKAQKEEAARFFNQSSADADFEHWSRAHHWTLEEAISLAFGKAPELVTWKKLEPYKQVSPFVTRYARLRDLAQRALPWQKLFDPVLPSIFIDWMRKNELDFPSDLAAKVATRQDRLADWKSAYDKLAEQHEKRAEQHEKLVSDLRGLAEEQLEGLKAAAATIEELRAKVAALEKTATGSQAVSSKSQSPIERDNMLKVIYGLAVHGYRFDPTAKRSAVVPEMISDLAAEGLQISDDTLRRYLREAEERLSEWREATR